MFNWIKLCSSLPHTEQKLSRCREREREMCVVSGFICSCAVRTMSWNGEPTGSIWSDRSETLLGYNYIVLIGLSPRESGLLPSSFYKSNNNGPQTRFTLRRLRLSALPVYPLFRWGSTKSHALLRCLSPAQQPRIRDATIIDFVGAIIVWGIITVSRLLLLLCIY